MATWVRETIDTGLERRILTGLIVSDRVLRRLSLAIRPRHFTVPFAATVCRWCSEYLKAYDKAPGRHVTDLYEAYRRNGLDQEEAELIGRFLASISGEYEDGGLNEDYLLDQAGDWVRERSLTLLKEDLEGHLAGGNLLGAEEAVARYSAPGSLVSLGCEPLRNQGAIRDALEGDDSLFRLPGDLGRLLGPFVREDAWGLVGSYKGGKTWLMNLIRDQALYNRLNVARFSFEMNERKENRRLIQELTGRPLREPRGTIWWPVFDCLMNQSGECRKRERRNQATLYTGDHRPPFDRAPAGYRPCTACRGTPDWIVESWAEPIERQAPTWRQAWRHLQAVGQQLRGARYKFQYWPMRSAGVPEIRSTLEVWEHLEGFIPDVIIVDSPDLMDGGDERRDIVRRRQETVALAQRQHCLLFMVFQAGSKDAIGRKAKRDSDIGESVQILGDVDGMIVHDRDETDERALRCRIRTSVKRDDARGSRAMVLQCLDLGQPYVDSAFMGVGK